MNELKTRVAVAVAQWGIGRVEALIREHRVRSMSTEELLDAAATLDAARALLPELARRARVGRRKREEGRGGAV
jgi:hypothetical protein